MRSIGIRTGTSPSTVLLRLRTRGVEIMYFFLWIWVAGWTLIAISGLAFWAIAKYTEDGEDEP